MTELLQQEARESSVRPARTLGTLTIGQAPRSDIAPILSRHMPGGVEMRERGLLDGLSDAEIRSRYGAEQGKPVLLTRLLDGRSVELSARKVRDGIEQKPPGSKPRDATSSFCCAPDNSRACVAAAPGCSSPTASFRRRSPRSLRIASSA
jgi:AroM protein